MEPPCHVGRKGIKPQSGSRISIIRSMSDNHSITSSPYLTYDINLCACVWRGIDVLQHRWLFYALTKSVCKLTTQHMVKLIQNCQHDNCSFHKPGRNLPSSSYKAILLMKQKSVIPHWYTIFHETEKLDRSLIDQCLGMLCFFKKMLGEAISLTKGVFVTQLSSNARISIWQIVWVTTHFCFMRDMLVSTMDWKIG